MAIVGEETTQEELDAARQLAVQQQEFEAQIASLQRAHEERVLELRIVEQGRVEASKRRWEAGERVAIAAIKLLPVLLLALLVPILVLAGRKVPQFIQTFMAL